MKLITALVGFSLITAGILLIATGEKDARKIDHAVEQARQNLSKQTDVNESRFRTMSHISGNSRVIGRIGGIALVAMGIPWFFFRNKKNED